MQVPDPQQHERHIEAEEQGEEGDGGAQRTDQEEEGEDEPAYEVQTELVGEGVGARGREGFFDLETARGQDDGEGDPEAAVGGEGGGAEGVAHGHFPGECMFSIHHVRHSIPGRSGTHHIPANSWTKPPYPNAIPTTKLGALRSLVPMLIKPRTNVVSANALNPRGAGLAILRSFTWR